MFSTIRFNKKNYLNWLMLTLGFLSSCQHAMDQEVSNLVLNQQHSTLSKHVEATFEPPLYH